MLQQEWQHFLEAMYSRAHTGFHHSDLNHALQEKVDEWQHYCRVNFFREDDRYYIETLLDAVMAQTSAESYHLYAQGYADCVRLLRLLVVL